MWEDKFLAKLQESNRKSLPYEDFYDAFALSAKRATANITDVIDPEYVGGLESQVKELTKKLAITIEQLNQTQRRNRDMIEEQYMKTHAVQQLNDEIIALNLQLNVSEDKQKTLEKENEELIARWVAKVDADSAA